MYYDHTLSGKNPDQKILFFHGEIQFSKCGIWTEFRPIRQVVILFREGLHVFYAIGKVNP